MVDFNPADRVSERPEAGYETDTREGTCWRRSERVLWREVLGDVVLVRADGDSDPFALAGGAALWSLLAERRDMSSLLASMDVQPGDYEVKAEEFRVLLRELEHIGVVDGSD